MGRHNGCWVALHTSPNIDPHCTLAWWPASWGRHAVALHRVKIIARDVPLVNAWVADYEMFGVRHDVEVAMLAYEPHLHSAVDFCTDLHDLVEWPIRPHVTAHNGRKTFTFAWVGLHLPNEHRYLRLEGDM